MVIDAKTRRDDYGHAVDKTQQLAKNFNRPDPTTVDASRCGKNTYTFKKWKNIWAMAQCNQLSFRLLKYNSGFYHLSNSVLIPNIHIDWLSGRMIIIWSRNSKE